MKQNYKLITNSSVLLAYTGFEVAILFLFNILAARFLGPKEFGRFIYLVSFVMLFTFLADLGISLGIIKSVVRSGFESQQYIFSGFFLKLLLTALFLVIIVLSFLAFGRKEDVLLIIYLAIAEGLRSGAIYIAYIFRGMEKMIYEPLFFGLDRLILLIIGTVALLCGYGVNELIIIISAAKASSFVIAFMFYVKYFGTPRLSANRTLILAIIRESYPIAIASLFNFLMVYLPPVFLTTFKDSRDTGIFQAAFKVTLLPILLCTVFVQSIYPSMISRYSASENDRNSVSRFYSLGTKMILNVALPSLVFFSIFSKEIIILIYGQSYIGAVWVLRAMGPYILFSSVLVMSMYVLFALNKGKIVVKIAIPTSIVCFLINYFFISIFGINGAVFSLLLISLVTLTFYLLTLHRLGYRIFRLRDSFVQVLSSFIMFLVIYNINGLFTVRRSYLIFMTIILGLSIYFIFLALLGGISHKEREILGDIAKIIGKKVSGIVKLRSR